MAEKTGRRGVSERIHHGPAIRARQEFACDSPGVPNGGNDGNKRWLAEICSGGPRTESQESNSWHTACWSGVKMCCHDTHVSLLGFSQVERPKGVRFRQIVRGLGSI